MYPRNQSPLYSVKGFGQLAHALHSTPDYLDGLANAAHGLYQVDRRETSPGKFREIENPDRDLKLIQRKPSKLLLKIQPPDYLYNPVKGRGPMDNAAAHFGAKVVWTVDVKSYFENTRKVNVFVFFNNEMKCARDVSAVLAKIVTLKDHIPTGAPSSPIISFYANEAMWNEAWTLCERLGLNMTVYMDDLTVSGDNVPFSLRRGILKLLARNDFRGHKQKLFRDRPAHITGSVLKPSGIDAPFEHYRKTRLIEKDRVAASQQEHWQIDRRLKGLRIYRQQTRRVARALTS